MGKNVIMLFFESKDPFGVYVELLSYDGNDV